MTPKGRSQMTDDQGFRRALRDERDDTGTRSVYADWLVGREDSLGTFLRLEVELAALPPDDERREPLEDQLRELQATLDVSWLAELDRTRIENCLRFTFQCPQQWENLKSTKREEVRFCAVCKRKVFHCHTIEQARTMAWRGQCVAVDSRLAREEGDIDASARMMLGRILPAPLTAPFRVDDQVRILNGMFKGMDAHVLRINPVQGTASVS